MAFLLLIGQQAGLLHHLGHDFDRAAGAVAAVDGGTAERSQDRGQDNSDADGRLCMLCVGFGAGSASAANDLRFSLASPTLVYARPLADAPRLTPVALTGTPIRGPPPHFSA